MVNKERLINEFCTLVSIDSPPFKERQMADVLIKYLEELGFVITEDNAGEYYQGNCGNVYGYLKGDLEGDPILFSSHMDTVEPALNKKAVVHADGTITSDGTTVLGADDIAGVVSILEAIRTIQELKIPHRDIEVLFTIAEEVYIRGSEVFDYSKIKSKQAYVLDLSGPVGTAAIKAPTLISFTAKIIGKAAHAGFAPEEGIHAIAIAAQAINEIKQGRIDKETTVNIGTIEGGKARNIVPEECILRGEVRSLNHDKALNEIEKIKDIFHTVVDTHHAVLDWEDSFGCLAYDVDQTDPVVMRFDMACKELNYQTEYIETFGGSDNNNFMKHGITGIVLACGMNSVHSCSEYTHIDELVKCSKIVMKLMTGE